MYRIIGSDQKEYGPVSADQLRQWLAQGRVNRLTKVKSEGATDWQTLGDFPELVGSMGAPPVAGQSPLPGQTIGRKVAATTSGLAITSLILGILGFCGITAIVGLILGIIALFQINKSQGRLSGGGIAIAGICVSGLMLILSLFFSLAMFLPAVTNAKNRAQSITCVNNLRQLELGVMMAVNANTNHLPTANTWCDTIQPYVNAPRVFQCVAGNPGDRCHFAFNAALSGLDMSQVRNPATTVMVFEADGGWNQTGGSELLNRSRHRRGAVVGFADGHVELVTDARLSQLNWDP